MADNDDSNVRQLHSTPEAIEEVWVRYWAPILSEGGITALKAELFEYHFLVDQARKVYRHATGGLCDDLCASAEGIIAMADSRVGDLTRVLRERIEELEAETASLRAAADPP